MIADVNKFTVVHNFWKGRAEDATVHRLLRARFDLQMREGVWLRLRWIPSEANVEADNITRPGRDDFVRSAPTYLQSCGLSLARSISITWLRPRLPRREIGSHVSRDTSVTGPRELFFFRKMSRACRERQRARLISPPPYRIGQPSSSTPRRATSTRGRFTFLRSGFIGAAHGDRSEAACISRLPRRQKRILCRAPPAGPPVIRIPSVKHGGS